MELEARQHVAQSVASRRRLLQVLGSEGHPMDAASLAASVGMHVTTLRFHLDVLEDAGLVRRHAERSGRPGRPRQLYSAVTARDDGNRQLAEVLTGALVADSETGVVRAEQAGRRWAESLHVASPVDVAPMSFEDATDQVGQLFEQLGFAPEIVTEADRRRIELHACPFRELASSAPQIVCTMHLGLLRGALSHLGVEQAEQATLSPFVAPELCVAAIPGQ